MPNSKAILSSSRPLGRYIGRLYRPAPGLYLYQNFAGAKVMSATHLSAAAGERATPLPTRSLSPALGAEILGVDLSQPPTAALAAQMQDIWHQNLVILLRGQKL